MMKSVWLTLALPVFAALAPASPTPFSTPPYPLYPNATLSKFEVQIPDHDIQILNAHLKLFRTPRATYENSQADWKFGVPRDWLVDSVDYWLNEFDWRKQERSLNSLPQFKLSFEDDQHEHHSVHFAALFSAKKDAVPIILSHGWPDSYMMYMPILKKVQQQYTGRPDEMPYHLIVPSLIGTGFSSSPPLNKPFYTTDTARIFHQLMLTLGFGETGYVAHGFDVGSMVSEYMLQMFEECKAAHVTLWWGSPAYNSTTELPSTSLEKHALQRMGSTQQWGQPSMLLHADRSSTAGLAIGGNPISELVWIGERMILWSNPKAPMPIDEVLAIVSLYWFTNCYPSSFWVYAAFRNAKLIKNETINSVPGTAPTYTGKPLGYSWFPDDVGSIPESYFNAHGNIYTHFYHHNKGAHFSPFEEPDLVLADIEDFVSRVWHN